MEIYEKFMNIWCVSSYELVFEQPQFGEKEVNNPLYTPDILEIFFLLCLQWGIQLKLSPVQ